ncbi:hypothetical protein [Nonomuraea sp. NPDC050540]|uniref:hypothetical protein n=1 Tax=Nonomuraea sp. NPDC050540 TaxID=3364367 RepID=UPI0037A626AB
MRSCSWGVAPWRPWGEAGCGGDAGAGRGTEVFDAEEDRRVLAGAPAMVITAEHARAALRGGLR